MAKCAKCDDWFHPDLMLVIDESMNAQKCVFCYLDKTEITIQDEETGEVQDKVTKREASARYKAYLNRLKRNPKIREKMFKDSDSNLIL